MKELKFPLIGIICSYKSEDNEREENYLYTVSELLPIDPELIADCLSSENECEFFQSKKSFGNKVIMGFCIYNKESLYAFLHGKYNGQINGHVCYWQNIQKDLYNQELVSKTMTIMRQQEEIQLYSDVMLYLEQSQFLNRLHHISYRV